jgi:hypothetical protein
MLYSLHILAKLCNYLLPCKRGDLYLDTFLLYFFIRMPDDGYSQAETCSYVIIIIIIIIIILKRINCVRLKKGE